MQPKPIKRSKYLLQVSREHHDGLLFCWKLRQGVKRSAAGGRIAKYVAVFWNDHLTPHFKDEEALLLQDSADPLVKQALEEHRLIQRQVKMIVETPHLTLPGAFLELADCVDKHIRFEERELFPHLEKIFSEDRLKSIEIQLQSARPAQGKDDYPDEFWKDLPPCNDAVS